MLNSKFDRREANRAKFSQNIAARRANREDSGATRRDAKKADREVVSMLNRIDRLASYDFDTRFSH